MARYRVVAKSFLQATPRPGRGAEPARLYEAGTEIEFDGEPGPSLTPLDSDARRAMARSLYQKAGKRGAHTRTLEWAATIGAPPGSTIAEATRCIHDFIARNHSDARVRARFTKETLK
jgi:hypothetical protein